MNLREIDVPTQPDMCSCGNCGWKGKVFDCETDWESDGWEMPQYMVHLCPQCEDGGCIDNYWYSEDLIDHIKGKK